MKVSILEFETIGLRCPNAKVSFKNKETGSVINLLQMPNGTGKTTMINRNHFSGHLGFLHIWHFMEALENTPRGLR